MLKQLEGKRAELDGQLSLSKDVSDFFLEQEAVLRRVVEEMGRQREQVVVEAREKIASVDKDVADQVKKECERRIDVSLRQMVNEESEQVKGKLQNLKSLQSENRKAVSQRLKELK